MILKDVFCLRCELIQRDMDVGTCDWTAGPLECPACREVTAHKTLCNGGAKLKTYLTNWDGRDWSGDIQHMGIEATYADGTPVHENAGKGPRTDVKYRDQFEDRVADKRDRKRFKRKQAEGSNPLRFT